jgi:sugar porter (SP) family MFS transporter
MATSTLSGDTTTHSPGDEPGLLTGRMLAAALVSAVGGLLYGYDTGIISGALLQISDEFGIGHDMEQVIAAAILFGAVVGALSCSFLSERNGRKRTILVVCCVFVAGTLLSGFAPSAWALVGGRIVLGFAVGGATQTVPMYVAELAPARIRGRLVLAFQLAIGAGIVIATVTAATDSIGWRTAVACAAVPAFVMGLLVLRLPESPRWLVKHHRSDDAREVLDTIRPSGYDAGPELDEIESVEREKENTPDSERGWRGLRRPVVRPALILGCGIAMFTQLSGIEMIIYYSPTILTDNGFSTSAALDVSVGLGVTYLVMQMIGLSIIDRVGRRRLTLIMVPGAAAALVVLGWFFVSGNSGHAQVPYIVATLIVFMAFNAGGLQLMGWLTGSEVYPLAVRGAGTSIQSATLWSTNMLITLTLLTMMHTFGVGQTFWIYAGFNVLAFLFVWRRMPELTGHSLEDIEDKLEQGEFTPAGFARG